MNIWSEIKDWMFSCLGSALLPDDIAQSPLCMIKTEASVTLESMDQKKRDVCLQCCGDSRPNPQYAPHNSARFLPSGKTELRRGLAQTLQKREISLRPSKHGKALRLWRPSYTPWPYCGCEGSSLEQKQKPSRIWKHDNIVKRCPSMMDGTIPLGFSNWFSCQQSYWNPISRSTLLLLHLEVRHQLHSFPPTWIKDYCLLPLHIPWLLPLLQKGD